MSGAKGVFFTLDGIFAATLLLLTLILLPKFFVSESTLSQTAFLAQDAMAVLAALEVREVNTSRIQGLIANGSITDPNQSVLDQLGEFWAHDLLADAQNLSREVLGGLLDDYELLVGGDTIDGGTPAGSQLVSSRRMVSGITKGRPRAGFNARAIATKVEKTTTSVFRFHPEGSANEGGNGMDIYKKFNVTADDIIDAQFSISIHYGISDLNSMKIYVNGQDLGLQHDDWLYDEASNVTSGTQVAFTKANVTDKIVTGANTIQLSLRSQTSGHAHLHPGTRLEVTHTSTDLHDVSGTVTDRLSFDKILSYETGQKRSGVWAIMPINVPAGVTVTAATLYLHAQDIEPYTMDEIVSRMKGNCTGINSTNAWNTRIYLDDQTVNLTSPPASETNETIRRSYNLLPFIDANTNALSLYLNMYHDCFWGDGDSILYAEPITDPSGSSYVELTYTYTPPEQEYGKIDVNVISPFNTARHYDVTYTKQLNGTILRSFIELATLETQTHTVSANSQQVFKTPRPYATPGAIYVDNSYLTVPGINTFRLQDCVGCSILPQTSYSHTVLVPNQVGYGATFDNETAAVQDAVQRLTALLGSAIQALGIQNETLSVGNVPSLWGPALVEVRVWK